MLDTQALDARPAPAYPSDTRAKGWRFEVDMEAIKASDTWLKARTGAVRGALLLLWSEAWQQTPCGTLPNDDELISLLIDMPETTFAKNRKVLMRGWVEASDGRLYHQTITARVLSMLDKRASDAKRAATRRAKLLESQRAHPDNTGESRVTHGEERSEFDTKHQAPSTRDSVPDGTGAGAPPRRRNASPKPKTAKKTGGDPPAPGVLTDDEAELLRKHVEVAASLAGSAAGRAEVDKSAIWRGAKSLLLLDAGISLSAGGAFVGSLVSDYAAHGVDLVLDALVAMCKERPPGPQAWLKRACQLRAGEASKTNRQGRLEAANAAALQACLDGGETPMSDLEAANAAELAKLLGSEPAPGPAVGEGLHVVERMDAPANDETTEARA